MSLEKCLNCGGLIELINSGVGSGWIHPPSHTRARCDYPVPGMGLIETIELYYTHTYQYAVWARPENRYTSNRTGYTDNAILHGLRMQATVHWNNCPNSQCKNCLAVGQSTADGYMKELANGRHDLHPNHDQVVHMLAFEIHNAEVAIHPAHGRPGIMTCTYVVGDGSNSACSCYENGYRLWLPRNSQKLVPFNPEDMHYEPRYE